VSAPARPEQDMQPRVLLYEVKGEGEPIVLVPGGLTGWLSWIPHAERLAATRRPIRVQPIHNELGSAGRRGEAGYTLETERESLRLTLDELQLGRIDFAGWSGGARSLIEFALAYPERVRTLTLVEPAAYSILAELDEEDEDVERLNAFLDELAGADVTEDDLAEFLYLAGFVERREDAPEHPNWAGWTQHRMALSWQPTQLAHLPRSLEEIGGISCPVLIIRGTSTAPWLGRVADVLAGTIPGARLVELPGDHACHLQSGAAFLAALEEHLQTGARA
jgi:pimeloyl-ACP methyl ester carboxylesterase